MAAALRFFLVYWLPLFLCLLDLSFCLAPAATQLLPRLILSSVTTHLVLLGLGLWYCQKAIDEPLNDLVTRCATLFRGEISQPEPRFEAVSAGHVRSLENMICDLGEKWSKEAGIMQFDIEFEAIEYERRRVAKDLHDEILPDLSRITRKVEALGRESHVARLTDTLHATVGAIRDILGELHPVDLEEFGFVSSLTSLCRRHGRNTGKLVCCIERVEEFHLEGLQELCLYRAMQALLRMFTNSENDILIVTCDHIDENDVIIVRCVDKRVSSANWLSEEKPEFNAFESWCTMGGAITQISTVHYEGFPCDLLISIPANRRAADNE